MTREKLTEMGFVNIPKEKSSETAESETWEKLEDQVYANSKLAYKVWDELTDYAPDRLCDDTYPDILTEWIGEQVEALYSEM